MEKKRTSSILNLIRTLFFVNAAFWLILGMLSAFRFASDGSLVRLVYTILMLANAIVMGWFGAMILTGRNWIFFLAILYMALNVVLSVTDQFGWIDALILLLNVVILGLLFVARQRKHRAQETLSGEL